MSILSFWYHHLRRHLLNHLSEKSTQIFHSKLVLWPILCTAVTRFLAVWGKKWSRRECTSYFYQRHEFIKLKSVSFFIVNVHKLSSADSRHTIPCWAWKQKRAEELQSRRPLRSRDASISTNGQGFRSEFRASSKAMLPSFSVLCLLTSSTLS